MSFLLIRPLCNINFSKDMVPLGIGLNKVSNMAVGLKFSEVIPPRTIANSRIEDFKPCVASPFDTF